MKLEEYEQMLKNHDWFYEFSDDPTVYRTGQENSKQIYATSKQSEEHLELFDKYKYEMLTSRL